MISQVRYWRSHAESRVDRSSRRVSSRRSAPFSPSRCLPHFYTRTLPLTRCILLHASLRLTLRDLRGLWSRSDCTRCSYAHESEEIYSYFRSTVVAAPRTSQSQENIKETIEKKLEKVYRSSRIERNNLLELEIIKTIQCMPNILW